MMRNILGMAASLLLLMCVAASAQDDIPPAEIGVGGGGLLVDRNGDYTVGVSRPVVELRVTIPYTPRFAFEGVAMVSSHTSDSQLHKTDAVYVLEIKQSLKRSGRVHPFLTYGAAGYLAHFQQDSITSTRPDGTSSASGGFTYDEKDPPFFAVFGGGVQGEFGSRTALRIDVQAVTLLWVAYGIRASAGLSVAFGDQDAASQSNPRRESIGAPR